MNLSLVKVTDSYFETIDVDMISGRNFDHGSKANDMNIILNETTIREFDIVGDPIGNKVIYLLGKAANMY